MRKLAGSSLLLGIVALASSCTSSAASGQFQINWSLTLNGSNAVCADVGATSVQAYFTPVFGGTATVFSAPCSALTLTTALLPADDYFIDVDLVDSGGNVIDTISPQGSFSILGGDLVLVSSVFAETTFVGQGYFSVSWTLTDHTGRAISCSTAGAAKFQLIATDLVTTNQDIFLYNCTMGSAVTDPLVPDDYRVEVDLLDATNRMLNQFTPTAHYSISDGRITRLGTFEFNFTNI